MKGTKDFGDSFALLLVPSYETWIGGGRERKRKGTVQGFEV